MRRTLIMAAMAALLVPVAARADLIKQSSAYTRTVLMTSSTDHISGATGLTLTVKASKAGSAFATVTDTVTEIGSGRYSISLVSADTGTIGALDLVVTATGADPTDSHDQVVGFDPTSDLGAATLATIGTTTASTNTLAGTINTQTSAANQQANVRTGVLGSSGATPLLTNGSGYVTTSNPATGGSAVTEATIWAYGTRNLTGPVTLPPTPPTGYGGSGGSSISDAQLIQDVQSGFWNTLGTYTQNSNFTGTAPAGSYYGVISAIPASTLTAIKTDTLFNTLLHRQSGRYTFNSSTKTFQPMLDDGVTPYGSPFVLSVDSNGVVTVH